MRDVGRLEALGPGHAVRPLDPAADIVLDLGRDIPSSVRDWALTSERHPGRAEQPPAWVLDELLRFGDHRPADPDPYLQPLALPAGNGCQILYDRPKPDPPGA